MVMNLYVKNCLELNACNTHSHTCVYTSVRKTGEIGIRLVDGDECKYLGCNMIVQFCRILPLGETESRVHGTENL